MAHVVASGILNLLIDRLKNRVVDEFCWLMDVGAQLKKLEGTLSTIRDVLEDAEARQVKEKALTGWLSRLKDVAYDIDDLLDEDFANNRKRIAPESSTCCLERMVSNLLSLLNSVMSQWRIGGEIRKINEKLDQIANDRTKYGLRERSVVTCCRQEDRAREETGPFVIESEVYGREEDKKKIIEFLVDTSGGDLSVIAIVGMGGLGKTTLAQLVYNDQQIKDHFDEKMKIWVCVSDDFDSKRLVGSIIEQITGNPCNLTSMTSMGRKLKEELEKKRFLLVLDDVWNENYEKWNNLRCLLTNGATGSKVVVTTRNHQIPLVMTAAETHILEVLSQDHCWLLFEEIVFGRGACEKRAKLVTIGKEIAKKCGGVPLVARVLGGLMLSKRDENEWLAVLDNDSWKSEENDQILPALRLSYNHLPSHLKQCFAYCSIFPKDTEIEDETLVELWIAEGFIQQPEENVKLEDVGNRYLRELLSRSLFERSYASSEAIKMHDLVHDLAQSISGKECSSIDIAGNRRDIDPTITRYSSFIYTKEATPLILDILNKVKKLRTFYFLKSDPYVEIGNEGMMLKILETVFSSMKLLRALYLSRYPIKELPMSISNLRHLRYLNLSWTNLETLPHSIGNLSDLFTLNLDSCKSLVSLPTSIGNLSNLLTLNLDTCCSLVSLPTSIGNLSNLLTLNLDSCHNLVSLPTSIGNLSNLSTLNLKHCQSFVSLPDSIGNLSNISTLDFCYCVSFVSLPDSIGNLSNLLTLNLKSCESFVSLPDSIGNLSNLSTLNLESCCSLVSLPTSIGNLSNLLTLDLTFCLSIVSLPTSIGNLSNLSTLNLEHCQSFVSLPDSIGNLSNLLTLDLYGCESIVSLPDSIGNLSNLSTLNLKSCKRFVSLPDSIGNLSNLSTLNLESCKSFVSLPHSIGNLSNLSTLNLNSCESFVSLPDSIGNLSNLSTLDLSQCKIFVSLPTSIGNLSNLLTLDLYDCESFVSLPDSIGNLSNLLTLDLHGCESIVSLPTSIGDLSNLLTLNLNSCYNLVSLPTSIGDLSNLLTLNLGDCHNLVSLPTSIGNLSNLLTLYLGNCRSLVSLPTSIGHLKSLQTLGLMFTKIEKLPESLCCLSNLRSIDLFCCDSLLELPENMKDMKSLTNLNTGECYKLTGMPSGIGQLSHLRKLPLFVVSEKSECGLRELNGLNLLERSLEIRKLENVKNFQQARDANFLIEKHGLERLCLSWGLDTYKRQVEACVLTDLIKALALAEKVLEGLQPHQNLTELRINGYLGKIFPKWLESSSLPNLVSLCLDSCFGFETLPEISQWHNLRTLYLEKLPVVRSIPPLGHLPYLEELSLIYLLAVKSLGSEFYGTGDGAFPALRYLTLECMPELEEWCEASTAGQRSFPRLSRLYLINCPKLKVLPSSLPSLEYLYLGADYELLVSSIPRGAFPNLKNVYLPNFDESNSPVPQIVAERLTFQSCHGGLPSEPMVDDDELNFMRSVAGLP